MFYKNLKHPKKQTNIKPHTHCRSLSLTEHSCRLSQETLVNLLSSEETLPRSRSISPLKPATATASTTTNASTVKKPSALANILYKAKRQQPKQSATLHSIPTIQFDDITLTNSNAPFQLLDTDEYEADKSQLKNEFMELAFTKEFKTTINLSNLQEGRILDIGKGSSHRCIERSKEYPQLQVISIDNGELFQDTNVIPDNCRFINKNVLDTLENDLEIESFDFIHVRFTVMDLSERQYRRLLQLCWKLLKPNGNLELLELDMQICSIGTITNKWVEELLSVGNAHGFKLDAAKILADYIPQDDSINLQQKYQSLPMGLWGGRLGVLCRDDILDIYRRSQTALCQFYSRSLDNNEINSDIAIMSREMEQHRSFANFHFISVNKRPSYK
ncbi:unnamed protein product [Cunninghamella echinulata]